MAVSAQYDPVFVHASMRSGSTYFFDVLRRDPFLMCFNEAIIDGRKDTLRTVRRHRVGDVSVEGGFDPNHHFLERPDYEEFLVAWDEVMHLCPDYPEFVDYYPIDGAIPVGLIEYLGALMKFARTRDKRPVLCEVNSRGRAGAFRSRFGGYHIAQYRDPLSQFGSAVRAIMDGGGWGYLVSPAAELGSASGHPIVELIPRDWRPPALPWRTDAPSAWWSANIQYMALVSSTPPENMFRWHLLSWALSNLAATIHSDLSMDIDRLSDDPDYRARTVERIENALQVRIDLGSLKKFDRYYVFETFEVASVCDDVISLVGDRIRDGRLAAALRMLAVQPPLVPVEEACRMIMQKLEASLTAMAACERQVHVARSEWDGVCRRNRRIWYRPALRRLAETAYPLAAPMMAVARRLRVVN